MSNGNKPLTLITRDRSVVTGKKRLEHVLTYTHHPVFIACTDEPAERDVFTDMSFSICKDSGIIQLDKLIPLDVLYSKYHSEALGGLWLEHHEKFVDFLAKFFPDMVLEIGGSNCFMAEQYLKKRTSAYWTNIEPSPVPSDNPRIKVVSGFFDAAFKKTGKVDAVVHSHVLEHMYDPDAFLKNIYRLLDDGGLHIFSVPNLAKYLELGYSNCVNFEHSIFLAEYFIDHFLAKNRFAVIKKHYFHEHSIFYAARKTEKKLDTRLASKYREYKKKFLAYARNNNKIVADINRKIVKTEGAVYLFGAHVFSQMLVTLGLRTEKIKFVLDNSKIKQGKRLYGTDLLVQPPEFIRGEKKPTIILRVGAYKKEIQAQIRSINKSTVFIE
ncbi:MAG: hypothetical protein A3A43_02530 [Candidatus Liptonbacteria bacterium RIFCSPLOWO2_01_FULL_56_20]|uniref:C-methyltransferase domain-containing protein n=1 Tax=Candidatus Liptonbacteria bacterium RIFCSPLOWO2_01_FULL_56_20 TaxID=1798652 RepID=A0A1G2CHY9_9BACT|nr:MAG: hypothetical protein UY96_C0002G0044 [Parcubacteria group bacterium GW2011_GWB1_56_8]OGY98256.1 MAG: hypothetical protein A2681_00305 [Candidatus Liptonbacteria bacterium RIFCSPHIGHO2_01_FULL_56_18b]OGZ00847.1 MAG: hypothetical protein A3A43_02530 [Candidatus Liptonbacteria bacterium RIFCSPLOWO2_01_FULL_56_20]